MSSSTVRFSKPWGISGGTKVGQSSRAEYPWARRVRNGGTLCCVRKDTLCFVASHTLCSLSRVETRRETDGPSIFLFGVWAIGTFWLVKILSIRPDLAIFPFKTFVGSILLVDLLPRISWAVPVWGEGTVAFMGAMTVVSENVCGTYWIVAGT